MVGEKVIEIGLRIVAPASSNDSSKPRSIPLSLTFLSERSWGGTEGAFEEAVEAGEFFEAGLERDCND